MISHKLNSLLRFPALMGLVMVPMLMATGARATTLAESVVESSPLGEMSRQYPAMVREGIREGLVASGHVEPMMADSVAGLASLAFSAQRMRAQLVADLDGSLNQDQLEAVQAWYRTSLGQRFAAAEAAASRPDAWDLLNERSAALAEASLDRARAALFERYDQAVAASDITASIAESAQRRLIPAYIAVMGDRAPDAETLEQNIEQYRPVVRQQIETQVYHAFLSTYQNFSDAELERYLDFLESPSGRAFTEVAAFSIENGLLEPLEAVSSQMARLLGGNR